MVTKGARQVAGMVEVEMHMAGIPVVVRATGQFRVEVLVGSSATVADVERAREIAAGHADRLGFVVEVLV